MREGTLVSPWEKARCSGLEIHAGSLAFYLGLSSPQPCSLPQVYVAAKARFTCCVSLGTASTCQVHWTL